MGQLGHLPWLQTADLHSFFFAKHLWAHHEPKVFSSFFYLLLTPLHLPSLPFLFCISSVCQEWWRHLQQPRSLRHWPSERCSQELLCWWSLKGKGLSSRAGAQEAALWSKCQWGGSGSRCVNQPWFTWMWHRGQSCRLFVLRYSFLCGLSRQPGMGDRETLCIHRNFLTGAFHSATVLLLQPAGLGSKFLVSLHPNQPYCSGNFLSSFAGCCIHVYTTCAASASSALCYQGY